MTDTVKICDSTDSVIELDLIDQELLVYKIRVLKETYLDLARKIFGFDALLAMNDPEKEKDAANIASLYEVKKVHELQLKDVADAIRFFNQFVV